MPREYKTLQELHDRVQEMKMAYSTVGTFYLNEFGEIQQKVYHTLSECFEFADTKEEFIEDVLKKIESWERFLRMYVDHRVRCGKHAALVIDHLRKFVRHNIEPELWQHIPEFKATH